MPGACREPGIGFMPVPGARMIAHLTDNAGTTAVELSDAELQIIEKAFSASQIIGARYHESELDRVDR
jgi:aryl-alcohol dehydrogenase-like predicted oxidoreductase